MIAGHTHGGQITIFGWAPFTPKGSSRLVSGEYATPLGRLYVTRGLGTSLLPIRLGARPELVFVR
jgi:predicted MPP superfamily phosphohydrolase